MNIAVFVDHFPSLTQTFVLQQISGLAARGHRMTILTRQVREIPATPGSLIERHQLMQLLIKLPLAPNSTSRKLAMLIPCFFNPSKLIIALRAVFLFRTMDGGGSSTFTTLLSDALFFNSRDSHYDIIHCHFGMLGAHAERLRRTGVLKGKIVTSFRGYDTEKHVQIYPGDYLRLLHNGDGFLPVCDYFSRWLQNRGCPPSRIRVIHSGIDVDQLHYSYTPIPTGGTLQLIAVGRLVEKKGFGYLLQALVILNRESPRPVHLTLVGDGTLMGYLNDTIETLQLSASVTMRGSTSHVETLDALRLSHMVVVPSVTAADGDQEGIPNVAKEAMALGIPVVATAHAGTPELIEDSKSGLLVAEKDPGALAEAILQLSQHPEICEKLAKNARVTIEESYSIGGLNEKLIEYFESLCY